MPKSNVTDSSVKRMISARKTVTRIKRIRKSVLVNLLLLGIPLGISYLLMICRMEGGFAGYLALSAEQRLPVDLFCLVTTTTIFLVCHAILLIAQFTAKKQQEEASIDLKFQDDAEDAPNESTAGCMRYQKSYRDMVFDQARLAHTITNALSITGVVIFLVGVILSFMNLVDPAWLPLACALTLDLMIFLCKFYFAESIKNAKEEQVYIRKCLAAQQAIELAEKLPDGTERSELTRSAADSLLERSSSDKEPKKEKNEKMEELPGLRLIISKNKSE